VATGGQLGQGGLGDPLFQEDVALGAAGGDAKARSIQGRLGVEAVVGQGADQLEAA